MNTMPNQERTGAGEPTCDAVQLLSVLDALQPGEQQQKNALFAQAYPGILRAIARKVPQKDILSALSRGGLKLHPVRYREMLNAEHQQRNDRGERTCCETCGAALQLPPTDEPSPAHESVPLNGQPGNGARITT